MLIVEQFYNKSTIYCPGCGHPIEFLGDELPAFCGHCRFLLPDVIEVVEDAEARIVHHLDEEIFE